MLQIALFFALLFGSALLFLSVGTAVATYFLAAEVRLFLRAPQFYVQKLLGPPSHSKQARTIAKRIRGLLPQDKTSATKELSQRVERLLPTLEALEAQKDDIVLYLEYDVYQDRLGQAAERKDPAGIRTLEERRVEIEGDLDQALLNLKQIETRVAARVHARKDAFFEDEFKRELLESVADLDAILEEEKKAGLLPPGNS